MQEQALRERDPLDLAGIDALVRRVNRGERLLDPEQEDLGVRIRGTERVADRNGPALSDFGRLAPVRSAERLTKRRERRAAVRARERLGDGLGVDLEHDIPGGGSP